jgi:hypothetical protein
MKPTHKELFDFVVQRVHDLGNNEGLAPFRAFPRWFAQMYYPNPQELFSADGAGDGKVDLFFYTVSGNNVTYHIINSKYTEVYNQAAPVNFYDEVLAFHDLFSRAEGRPTFLQKKRRRGQGGCGHRHRGATPRS